MENEKVLAIYVGPHPSHKLMGDAISATPFFIKQRAKKNSNALINSVLLAKHALSVPSDYEIILCESCYYYPALKKKLELLGKSKIINMITSPIFYDILEKRVTGTTANILMDLAKYTDGYLVSGKYGEEIYKKLGLKKPYRIIYPFVLDERYEKLLKIENKLQTKTIAIIAGNDPKTKGLDILLQAFRLVYEKDPKIKLKILGNIPKNEILAVAGFDGKEKCVENIEFIENTNDIPKFLSTASLYVQPSRGETFSVAALETMQTGVPVMVSEQTGVREVVQHVRGDFVAKLEADILATGIIEYFKMSNQQKLELGKKFQEAAKPYNQKTQLIH